MGWFLSLWILECRRRAVTSEVDVDECDDTCLNELPPVDAVILVMVYWASWIAQEFKMRRMNQEIISLI